jgi:broad specificity phosphatase PhoE
VENLGIALKDTAIEAIYSSPLSRAMDTARAIAQYHSLTIEPKEEFREINVGEFEGRTLESLQYDFSTILLEWREGKGKGKLPKGESLQDVHDRVWPCTQEIVARHKGNVVIASHYFVVLIIIGTALGLPLVNIRRLRVQPASISIIDFSGDYPYLELLSDTCHLKED